MKALSKVALLGLVAGLFVTATGCGQEGLPAGKSPEDIITEALLNQEEVTQFVFEMDMKADLKGDVDGEKNDLKGTFSISGTQDEEKMAMEMNVDGKMNEDSVKGVMELRANEDGVFVLISGIKISDSDIQELVDSMLEDYMDEWIMLSFMDTDEILESGEMAEIDYAEGDPLPFTNIQYKGNTDILGVNSYHFTADIDEEMILGMVDVVDMADTQKFLDAATMTGDVYVAVNEMVMTGFGGVMKLNDPEMNGTLEMNFKINPTKSDDVKTPDYTKELTEEDIAMLMFGGAMMDPSAGMDMEFDDSMMMDDFDEDMSAEDAAALLDEMGDLDLYDLEGAEDLDLSGLEGMY